MVLLFIGHCMNSERKQCRILIILDHLSHTYNYKYLGKHHNAPIQATFKLHFEFSNILYCLYKVLD